MSRSPHEIPQLLHDASLTDLNWDPQLRTLRLFFSCLRRNTDGSAIEDPTVELQLGGVEEIVAYYSPVLAGVRPSEFSLDFRLTAADLERRPGPSGQADLAINSAHEEFMMATSYIKESLFTAGGQIEKGDRFRVHLDFWPQSCFPVAADIAISVACNFVQPYSAGVALDIDTWKAEFDSWWMGWQERWATSEQEDGEESEVVLEDVFIPAGKPSPPDLSYLKPAEPPFQIEPTDATHPRDTAQPIRSPVRWECDRSEAMPMPFCANPVHANLHESPRWAPEAH